MPRAHFGSFRLQGRIGVQPGTRILPWLTPLAALGFAIIQVLAIIVHASLGETATTLPMNLVLLAPALFVVWGRWRRAPISPRA